MWRFRKQRIALLALSAAVGLWCSSQSLAARPSGGGGGSGPSYQIIELDSGGGTFECGAEDINSARLIVGQVQAPNLDEPVAACWTVAKVGKTMTSTLHLLDGDGAFGINESGEIVGERNGQAVYWPSRTAPPMMLPIPANSTWSSASAINEQGIVCGVLRQSEAGQTIQSAVLWRINIDLVGNEPTPTAWGPLFLPRLAGDNLGYWASDLSDNNPSRVTSVVGGTFSGCAVTWTAISQPDGKLALGAGPTVLDYGEASGVNNAGSLICGQTAPNAVLWAPDATRVLDKRSFASAQALDINPNDVTVGYANASAAHSTAVVWPSPTASMISLDKFSAGTAFSALNRATAVNDSGDIVGTGWDNNRGMNLGFLAIPK